MQAMPKCDIVWKTERANVLSTFCFFISLWNFLFRQFIFFFLWEFVWREIVEIECPEDDAETVENPKNFQNEAKRWQGFFGQKPIDHEEGDTSTPFHLAHDPPTNTIHHNLHESKSETLILPTTQFSNFYALLKIINRTYLAADVFRKFHGLLPETVHDIPY